MNWVNIHTETLRGEEFIGAEPLERATWISILGWCCAQENDGIIKDCKSWGSRKWQQLCGVTKEEAGMESSLYHFNGGDLIVSFYPIDQQAAVKSKRENGKKGGRPPKANQPEPLNNKDAKPHGYPSDNHMGNLDVTLKESNSKSNSKGKERNTSCPLPDIPALIWENSLKVSRERSSKKQVGAAWKSIPSGSRPTPEVLIHAMNTWKLSEKWQNGYAEGLHIWINNRQWDNLPQAATNRPAYESWKTTGSP